MKSAFAIAALLMSNLFAKAQYNQFWGLPICVASPADVRAMAAKRGATELTSPMRNRLEYLGEFDGIANVRIIFDYAAPYGFGQRDGTVYGAYAVFENRSDSSFIALFQAYARKFAAKYAVPCAGCDSGSMAEAPQKIRDGGQNISLTWRSNGATDPCMHTIHFNSYKIPAKQLVLGCTNMIVRTDGQTATGLSLSDDLKNGQKDY